MTLDDFIKSAGITMTVTPSDANPYMDDDRNPMDHWKCTLHAGRSRMGLYFSKGRGHNGNAPTVAEVLDCLASDSASVENATNFEDWCGEYGYDTDSRKAERTFKQCGRQAAQLRVLLGNSAYQTLLFDTDRL